MRKNIICFHAWILNPLLNLFPIFWIDIFYDNQTYIGNTLDHPLYLILWSFSSALGFYFYSKKIWDSSHVPYPKKTFFFLCLGMCLSCWIPYSNQLPTWINDFHVWMAIICVSGFIYLWIRPFFFHSLFYMMHQKQLHILYMIFFLCLCSMIAPGHITSLCEILFSFGVNAYLAYWSLYKA